MAQNIPRHGPSIPQKPAPSVFFTSFCAQVTSLKHGRPLGGTPVVACLNATNAGRNNMKQVETVKKRTKGSAFPKENI